MPKYQNSLKFSHRMQKAIPNKRPNCEQILLSKHLWALDKNEFQINYELRRVLEEKSKDKQSIYHMICAKLNNS
jgi:hypothetical protein